ncbi:hypothetical protein DPMN_139824 [Dreissena polymorpha]|uniref:Uncharacterized protein n=1 Tax=Dreissena polymorpha TaxID=45954 RepID=A0A9D4JIG1_DREPO|nr:hypothetical protein DPMN_139824 [Dreissena polymorpha]
MPGPEWPRWSYEAILFVPVATPVVPGPSRRLPAHPEGIEHFNTFPLKPRFIPVEPLFIPVDAGSRTGAPPASY